MDVWIIRTPDPGPHSRPSVLGSWPRGPHKSSNKLSLLLVTVQSLWSCVNYFQWFTGYLNHVDLLMSQVHVSKETTPLFNMHLNFFVGFILGPTKKYMFRVNNKKTRLICWICSKLKINIAWHCSGVFYCSCWPQSAYQYSVFILNFEQIFVSRVWKTSHSVLKTQKA